MIKRMLFLCGLTLLPCSSEIDIFKIFVCFFVTGESEKAGLALQGMV
jgi:hypothetical protein